MKRLNYSRCKIQSGPLKIFEFPPPIEIHHSGYNQLPMLAEQPTGLLVHPQGDLKRERQVQVCPPHCLEAFAYFQGSFKVWIASHTYPTKAARPFSLQVEKSFAIRSGFSIVRKVNHLSSNPLFGNGKGKHLLVQDNDCHLQNTSSNNGFSCLSYYALRMLRRGGYGNQFFYRLGFWPQLPPKRKNITRIWIQAVSVGELSSLAKLLDFLLSNPSIEVVFKRNHQHWLKNGFPKNTVIECLDMVPFLWTGFLFPEKVWRTIEPDIAILVDSELWPEHFEIRRKRNIPLLIINARLSDRTFSRLSSPWLKWTHPLIFLPTYL